MTTLKEDLERDYRKKLEEARSELRAEYAKAVTDLNKAKLGGGTSSLAAATLTTAQVAELRSDIRKEFQQMLQETMQQRNARGQSMTAGIGDYLNKLHGRIQVLERHTESKYVDQPAYSPPDLRFELRRWELRR